MNWDGVCDQKTRREPDRPAPGGSPSRRRRRRTRRPGGRRGVRESAADAFEEFGIYAVSVFLALDEPVEELCRHEPYLSRYKRIRRSTVGRLRTAGFALIPTLDRPHYDVVLPDVTDATMDRLDSSFDPPEPNSGAPPPPSAAGSQA